MLRQHRFHKKLPRAGLFSVKLNNKKADVLSTECAEFVSAEADEQVEVEIKAKDAWVSPRISPQQKQILCTVEGKILRFTVPAPMNVLLQSDNHTDLFLYLSKPSQVPRGKDAEGCTVIKAGERVDAGVFELKSGESLYLEGGAVLVGRVRAKRAENIRIYGPGIVDGEDRSRENHGGVAVELNFCTNARIEDVLMIRPSTWMCRLGGCDGIMVSGIKQLSNRGGTDGIDIVGSKNVEIQGCFLRNGDDNIAIKAMDRMVMSPFVMERRKGEVYEEDNENFCLDVKNITVKGCAFYNSHGGSAMEIGYETRCSEICDVLFEDIDVIAVHNMGSVFGIHNGDEAEVHHVTWRNIRVEHHYDKLIDFRNLFSRWNTSEERGRIHDVILEDVSITDSPFNAGYTVSVIAGWSADQLIRGIQLRHWRRGGVKMRTATDFELVTRHAEGVDIL
jgi:hypothetical protein